MQSRCHSDRGWQYLSIRYVEWLAEIVIGLFEARNQGIQTPQPVKNRRTARMGNHEMCPIVQQRSTARSDRMPNSKR